MTIFLILAPYAAYGLLMLVTSAAVSLFVSAAICLAVIAFDLARGRSVKILGAGSVIVFTAVGLYVAFVEPGMSNSAVKLVVDIGIFLSSLTSNLIRRPTERDRGVRLLNLQGRYPWNKPPAVQTRVRRSSVADSRSWPHEARLSQAEHRPSLQNPLAAER